MNGTQWRTVCTGSQELAGAVCSQMGYLLEGNVYRINDITLSCTYLGSSVAALNSFPPGAFPEHRLDCTGGECTAVEANCTNSFVGLGVVCKNYEDITNMQVTTQLPTTSCTPQIKGYPGCTCTDNFTTVTAGSSVLATLLVAVTVLVVLQGVTMIALISTCVVFKRKLKQR